MQSQYRVGGSAERGRRLASGGRRQCQQPTSQPSSEDTREGENMCGCQGSKDDHPLTRQKTYQVQLLTTYRC